MVYLEGMRVKDAVLHGMESIATHVALTRSYELLRVGSPSAPVLVCQAKVTLYQEGPTAQG